MEKISKNNGKFLKNRIMKIGRRLKPKDKGFTETVKKYAWSPTFMTNGDLVWFESYIETRTWDELEYWYNAKGTGSITDVNMVKSYYWGWNIIERKRHLKK